MAAAMNARNQYTAGTSCTARSASSCSAFAMYCVMGTAAAVSIFVALSVRLCVLLHMVRISMLRLFKCFDKRLYS